VIRGTPECQSYDTKDIVAAVRELGFTPHVAQNTSNRRSAIDGRTTRHAGHAVSQRIRKRIEEPFGWIRTVGAGRKVRYIGQSRKPGVVQNGSRGLQPHPNLFPRRRRHRIARTEARTVQPPSDNALAALGPSPDCR
jgi:hypothetical protein